VKGGECNLGSGIQENFAGAAGSSQYIYMSIVIKARSINRRESQDHQFNPIYIYIDPWKNLHVAGLPRGGHDLIQKLCKSRNHLYMHTHAMQ
jgi:hypothetical protein